MSDKSATVSEARLAELAAAANDAARREAPQWVAFISLMVFLAISVGTTTHRALLDQTPMRLPLLNIDVPLVTFFWVAPLIVVIYHFYIQAQLANVTGKVARLYTAASLRASQDADAGGGDRSVLLEGLLEPLDGFAGAQYPPAARASTRLAAARLMTTVTLTIAPTALLVFFLLKFLPYQSEGVTWLHRYLVASCVLFSLYFRTIQSAPGTEPLTFLRGLGRRVIARGPGMWRRLLLVLGAIWFLSIATVHGETIDWQNNPLRPSWFLYDGELRPGMQRPGAWLFSRVLVLPDERLITAGEADLERELIARTSVLRGRSLRGAVLPATDLRKADLTAADLRGAMLDGVWFQSAYLGDTRLEGASLRGAVMMGATLGRARLRGASLDGAQLQGAWLDDASLQGAGLDGANLIAASLERAQLQGSSLKDANLKGAFLLGAQFQGATFVSADLEAADLRYSQAWLAEFADADLDLAALPALPTDADRGAFSRDPPAIDGTTPTGWDGFVQLALADIPPGAARGLAQARMARLARARPGAEAAVAPVRPLDRVIGQLAATTPSRDVAIYLGALACARDTFPYVLRGFLHQIWTDDPETRRALDPLAREQLAAWILGRDCPVSSEIPRDSKARLEAISQRRDAPGWRPAGLQP